MSITEFILMNFTNNPYERIMKEVPYYENPTPQKASEGSLCKGYPHWRGITCVFCYWKYLKEQS